MLLGAARRRERRRTRPRSTRRRNALAVLGDASAEVAAPGAQPIDLVAHRAQRRMLGAAVAAAGHRVGVGPARQVLAPCGGGRPELGMEMLHRAMVVSAPAESLRRTLQAVLRLTGLPAPALYPRAIVRPANGRIEIVFSGPQGSTQIDADLRLIGAAEDLEAVQLDLLAKLQAQGYETTWDRSGQGDPAARRAAGGAPGPPPPCTPR